MHRVQGKGHRVKGKGHRVTHTHHTHQDTNTHLQGLGFRV